MKLKTLAAVCLFVGNLSTGHAQTNNYLEGKIFCPTDDVGNSLNYCHYTVKNLSRGQTLIKQVQQTLFKGFPLTHSEGILEILGDNNKVITFWHNNPEILEKMKIVIPLLDTKESFSTNAIIELTTDIYEVSETGLSNLSAEISNLKIGSGIKDLDNSTVISGSSSGLGLDLKIGAVQLSGLISAERSLGTLKRKASIVRAVPNLSSIEYDDVTPVYFAPGAGTQVINQNAGIELDGTVSINADNEKLVTIKNYRLQYGVMTEDGLVNKVNLPFENLILEEGVAFPLVSSKSVGEFKTTTTKIFGLGKSVETENSKLLVFTTVKVYSWEDYVKQIRSLGDVGKQRFTEEDLAALPTNCPSDLEVLKSIELIARRDSAGDPILSLRFDKDLACTKNISTRVKVQIKGEKIPKKENTHYVSFQELMHIPIRIEGIPLSKFNDPTLDFKVVMKVSNPRTRVVHHLRFAPGSYDIRDSFWLK